MSSKMKKFLIALSIIAAGSLVIAISLFYSTGGLKQLSSSTNDISQTEEIDALGIKEINISSISTPVKIITNDGDKIKADFRGKIKREGADARSFPFNQVWTDYFTAVREPKRACMSAALFWGAPASPKHTMRPRKSPSP